MKCTYCGFSYDNEAKCPICGTPAPQQPAPTPEKPEPQPFLPPVQPPSGDAPKAPSPAASPAREDSGKGLRIATLCVLGVIASALIYLCLVMTFSYSLERGFESTAKEWSEDYDTFDAFGVPDNDMLNAEPKVFTDSAVHTLGENYRFDCGAIAVKSVTLTGAKPLLDKTVQQTAFTVVVTNTGKEAQYYDAPTLTVIFSTAKATGRKSPSFCMRANRSRQSITTTCRRTAPRSTLCSRSTARARTASTTTATENSPLPPPTALIPKKYPEPNGVGFFSRPRCLYTDRSTVPEMDDPCLITRQRPFDLFSYQTLPAALQHVIDVDIQALSARVLLKMRLRQAADVFQKRLKARRRALVIRLLTAEQQLTAGRRAQLRLFLFDEFFPLAQPIALGGLDERLARGDGQLVKHRVKPGGIRMQLVIGLAARRERIEPQGLQLAAHRIITAHDCTATLTSPATKNFVAGIVVFVIELSNT